MKELIEVIQKKINKTKGSETGNWYYDIDLSNSCINSDQYQLIEATILGDGKLTDIIRVRINYIVNNSNKLYFRVKKIRGIENAIKYIWDFPENFSLCMNCCSLIKSNSVCKECLFFKSYLQYKNKCENCGICQEESFRVILSCNHHFHKSCLLKMDPEDLKCPLCRQPVDEDLICELFDEDDDDEQKIEEIYSDDEDF